MPSYGVNNMARGQVNYHSESDNKPAFDMEMKSGAAMDRMPEILEMLEKQDTLLHRLSDSYEMLYNKLDAVRGPDSPQAPDEPKADRSSDFSPIAERLYRHNDRLHQLVMTIQRTVDSVQL